MTNNEAVFLKIQSAGFNITTCGNCGELVLHEIGLDELTCEACKLTSDISNFPDLYVPDTSTTKLMKFKLYFVEYHSDVELWKNSGYKLLGVDRDGWGEFEHVEEFEAPSVEYAKDQVYALYEMGYNSSGVFNVYHNNKLVFTEE